MSFCCLAFCDHVLLSLIFIFTPVYRWWPPRDVDAFCCAAGPAEVGVVPVAEARWPRSSQHPQPGRSDPCELGLGAGLPQAAPASNRVSAPFSHLPPLPTSPAPIHSHCPLGISARVCHKLKPQLLPCRLPDVGKPAPANPVVSKSDRRKSYHQLFSPPYLSP